MLRNLAYAFIVAGLVYTGINDLTTPDGRVEQLDKSFLCSHLKAAGHLAGVALSPLGKAELILTSKVIGGFLVAMSALVVLGIFRRLSAALLIVYLLAHFFIMNIDLNKTFQPRELFVGKEDSAFLDLAQLGSLLLIVAGQTIRITKVKRDHDDRKLK
eukprot:GILI01002646.1.p1 GENE.GILI01002646.1~~GILI01002646.1.p1  ORF type:complete len:170 (-),score=60.87 GILI01002646.1:156-629(-)